MNQHSPQLFSGQSAIVVDNVRLETLWRPTPSGSDFTWVLLHEGLGCVELWRDFPGRLQSRFRDSVFCWSRQGYGRSDPVRLPRPLDYMRLEAQTVVGQVLQRVPGERIILLGHSDGGSIAALYAGLCADPRVAGLVLVAPHFFTEQIAVDAIAEAKAVYESGELKKRLEKYHQDNVDCAFRGWNDAWLDPGFRQWDIRDCLPGITVPLMLVQGESDKYGTPAQLDIAAELAQGTVQIELIPGCDHWPHREAPEVLLAACGSLRKLAI